MTEFFFRKDFKADLPYFKKTKINKFSVFNTLVDVCNWLGENGINHNDSYQYIVSTTIGNIDPDCDEGIFIYIWLNAYIREISYFVWRDIDLQCKLEGHSEKERAKKADAAMKEFESYCKQIFN